MISILYSVLCYNSITAKVGRPFSSVDAKLLRRLRTVTDNFLRNYWAGRAGVVAELVVAAGLNQLGGQERPRLALLWGPVLPWWHCTGGSGRPQTSLTSTSTRPRSLLRPSRHMEEEEDKIDLGKPSPAHNLAFKSEQFLQHTIKLTQQLINREYILFKGVVVKQL